MLKDEQFYYEALAKTEIPEGMHDGIVLYLVHGIPPGSFLAAVLENDLHEAVICASIDNQRALAYYVIWFHNFIPATAWGSPENVQAWMSYRRATRQVSA